MTDYYPHPALKPLKAYPVSVRARISIERRICRRTIKALQDAGFRLRVHSGDEWETPEAADESVLMRALFNLDDAWLVAFVGGRKQKGWVRFVFGNDGWDVISDHTTNLEDVLKPVCDYAESLS